MTGDESRPARSCAWHSPIQAAIQDIEADRRRADREQARPAGGVLPLQRPHGDPVLGPDRRKPRLHRRRAAEDHQRLRPAAQPPQGHEGIYCLTQPPAGVGSRHGQWSAISLYCLGRYFNKLLPQPDLAAACMRRRWPFARCTSTPGSPARTTTSSGTTRAIAPIFTLHGAHRRPRPAEERRPRRRCCAAQEILISGACPRLGPALRRPRLPEQGRLPDRRRPLDHLPPADRGGHRRLPAGPVVLAARQPQAGVADGPGGQVEHRRSAEAAWAGARQAACRSSSRSTFGSFRSAADASGDYILLDGFNGASAQSVPHVRTSWSCASPAGRSCRGTTTRCSQRRRDGRADRGHGRGAAYQRRARPDGAIAVGEVPKAAFCNWRRTLGQRAGQYALIVDDLAFRTDSEKHERRDELQAVGAGCWDRRPNALQIQGAGPVSIAEPPRGWGLP